MAFRVGRGEASRGVVPIAHGLDRVIGAGSIGNHPQPQVEIMTTSLARIKQADFTQAVVSVKDRRMTEMKSLADDTKKFVDIDTRSRRWKFALEFVWHHKQFVLQADPIMVRHERDVIRFAQ